ncbi:protein kinase, putative [Toxoplasma gondii ME49]|uniref:Protein kinase, putative n=1 Tax=Toxoplasma gondii (strain ATCC 50611 / Me49) TaxID=508771 RepID=S8F9T2_TOXGM|nr:protein kinase, putative [Toxoplasma gondii ME49]EPT30353.1 protein kinase, putative [Toxoplasma gondii ME49]|eukprot:XP_002371398.2 protein kinase, putative [Toxoplasma gondii ME49]
MTGGAAAPRSSSGASRTPLSLRFSLTLLCSLVALLTLSVSLSTPASHTYVFAVVAADTGVSSVPGHERGASKAGPDATVKSKRRRERSKKSDGNVSAKGGPEESEMQDQSTTDVDFETTPPVARDAKTQSKRDATTRGKKGKRSRRKRGEKSKKGNREAGAKGDSEASLTEGESKADIGGETTAQVERDATTKGKKSKRRRSRSRRKRGEKSKKGNREAGAKGDSEASLTEGESKADIGGETTAQVERDATRKGKKSKRSRSRSRRKRGEKSKKGNREAEAKGDSEASLTEGESKADIGGETTAQVEREATRKGKKSKRRRSRSRRKRGEKSKKGNREAEAKGDSEASLTEGESKADIGGETTAQVERDATRKGKKSKRRRSRSRRKRGEKSKKGNREAEAKGDSEASLTEGESKADIGGETTAQVERDATRKGKKSKRRRSRSRRKRGEKSKKGNREAGAKGDSEASLTEGESKADIGGETTAQVERDPTRKGKKSKRSRSRSRRKRGEKSKKGNREAEAKGDSEASLTEGESKADIGGETTAQVERDATTKGKKSKRSRSKGKRGEKSKEADLQEGAKGDSEASLTEGESKADIGGETTAQVERDATTKGKKSKRSRSKGKRGEKTMKRDTQLAGKGEPQTAAIVDALLQMESGSLTEREAVAKDPKEGNADAIVGTDSIEARVAVSAERTEEGGKPAEAVSAADASKSAEQGRQKSTKRGKKRHRRNRKRSKSKKSHTGSSAPTTAGVSAPTGSLPLSSETPTSAEKEATEFLLSSGFPAISAVLASRGSKLDAAKKSKGAPGSTSVVDSESVVSGRERQTHDEFLPPVDVASVLRRANTGDESLFDPDEADNTSAATKAFEVTDDEPKAEKPSETETQLQELMATVPQLDELLQKLPKLEELATRVPQLERLSESEAQREASNEHGRHSAELRATGPSLDEPMRGPRFGALQATESKPVPTSLANVLISSLVFPPRLSLLFAQPASGATQKKATVGEQTSPADSPQTKGALPPTAELPKERAAANSNVETTAKSQGDSEAEKLLKELRELEKGMQSQTVGDISSTRGETESDNSRTRPESDIKYRGMSGSFSGSGPASSRHMKHRVSIRGSFGEADVVLLHQKPQRGDETAERTSSFSATADNSVSGPRRRGFGPVPRSIFGSAFSDLEAELQGDVAEFGDAAGIEESFGFFGERRGGGDRSRRSRERRSEDRSRRRRKGSKGHREAGSSAATPGSRHLRQVDRRSGLARAEDVDPEESSEESRGSREEHSMKKLPARERSSRSAGPSLSRRRSRLDHELEQRRAKEAMEAAETFDERGGYGSGGHNWLTPGPPLVVSGESWPRRGLLYPEPALLLEDSRAVQMMENAAKELAHSRQTPVLPGDRGRVAAAGGAFERLFPRGALFTLQPTHGQPFEPKTLKRGRFLKAGGGTLLFEVWEGRTRWALRLHLTELSERERTGLVSRFPVDRVSGAGVSAWQRTADGVCAEAEELELHAVRILMQQNEQPRDLFCRERIALPVAVGEVSSLPKVTQLRDGEHVTNIGGLYPLAACDMRELAEQYVMPEEVKLEAVRQMVAAVGRLHSRGVVHLDLKLEHFLLDNHGKVYLGDLSTSEKITGVNVEPTSCEFGSLESLSPEHLACWARQQRKFTPSMATDSWSLGVAIVQLWCGEAPFRVPDALWSNGPVAVAQYLDQLLRRTDGEIDFSGCPGGDITNPELKRIVTGLLTYDRVKRWLPLDVLFTSPLMIDPAVARNASSPSVSPLTSGKRSSKNRKRNN